VPTKEPEPDSGLLKRASDRLKTTATTAASAIQVQIKATAQQALSKENAKAALATKLVAVGLTAICLSAGIDYFSHDDDVHRAIAVAAHDAGFVRTAAAIEWADGVANEWKLGAFAAIPQPVRDHFAAAAFLAGAIAFGFGLRMKVRASPGRRGIILRDVGGIIAAPGLVMLGVFTYMSYRAAQALVTNGFGSVFVGLSKGEVTLGELIVHYGPWAWLDVGGVLLLGIAWGALGAAGPAALRKWAPRFAPPEGVALDSARRTLFAGAALSLGYYLLATLASIGSYGGALRVIAWPWKTDPGAFLAALGLMALGLGLLWAGTLEHRREEAAEG
jgi:MFS family permease